MSVPNTRCEICGELIAVKAVGLFATANVIGARCSSCADKQIVDAGGSSLVFRHELDGARFSLGNVTVTAGAIAALAESGQHAVEFLARHVRGDWGNFGRCDAIELTEDEHRLGWQATDDSTKINKSNLLNLCGDIMSEYATGRGARLWVITRLDSAGGTSILLRGEY